MLISWLQITSKLWGTWHSRVEEALDQTLANLGTDYLDRRRLFSCFSSRTSNMFF